MDFYTQAEVDRLKKYISEMSWDARNHFPRGYKFLSTSKIYSSVQKPKDWVSIATKCSANPNHEHYGKAPSEILEIWNTKSDSGKNRGNILDVYITAKLNKLPYVIPPDVDQQTLNKIVAWDKFNEEKLSQLQYVGSEIWMNSKLGIAVRTDALFMYKQGEEPVVLVADWKNNHTITTFNKWEKLLFPMLGLDDCDLVKYTFQVFTYKYILESEYKIKVPHVRIIQILENDVISHKPAFEYNENLMLSVFKHALSQKQAD